ncbi:peptidylprolyl isomerase [Candidatus Woesearchaeota archaeon]|nr:peptidylprolyl isomerase [Candidatus Woesearchaeota archaeon]
MAENVENGNLVQVHYTGTFDDGTVFDSSDGKDPLEVLAGTGMLIKGFDDALIGMKDGEEKEITIAPADAYGEPNDMLIQKIPRSELSDEITPEVGMVLGVKAPTGQVFPATITEVTDAEIVLDANHPLAGKTLHFKLSMVSHREPTEEDMAKFAPQGHSCGDGDSCGCEEGDSCGDSCGCGHDHDHE